MFMAPVLLKAGDRDGNGALTGPEFRELGEQWFSDWDKAGAQKLDRKQLRDGLNRAFGPPPGAEAAFPPMNLQGPKGKRNGVSAMMGIHFNQVHADLEFEGRTYKDVGIRYKGNGTFLESRSTLKRSLKIDLNKYVKGMELAGARTLNLHNNVTDASLMNESLAYRLYRDAGVPAPRVAYAKVFVTVPGLHSRRYFGLYSLVENVDGRFIEECVKARGGAIFKPVSPKLFTDLGDDWDDYRQTYDPKTNLTSAQEQRVIDFCKLVSGSSDGDFAARLGEFVELDELARYMAVMTWLSDLDGILGPGQNFYVFLHPSTHKFLFIPWDQDHSFGQFPMRGTQQEREQLSIRKPWDGSKRFLERIYGVDGFKTRYLARLNEFSGTVFRPERFDAQVAELAAAIRPGVEQESPVKLTRFEKAVAGESLAFEFGPPQAPPRTEGKKAGPAGPAAGPFGGAGPQWSIIPIRPFVKVRAKSVADQLAGKSAGANDRKLGTGRSTPESRFRAGRLPRWTVPERTRREPRHGDLA